MVLSVVAVLALAAPSVEDALDAWYVQETLRGRLAVPYHLARIEQQDDADAVLGWLEAIAQDDARNGPMVLRQVERWADGRDGPGVRAARATAHLVAAWEPGSVRPVFVPDEAGPWCEPALQLLEGLPPGPVDEVYTAVWWRAEMGAVCGRDVARDRRQLAKLGDDPGLSVARRTWYAVRDEVDEGDVALLQAMIEEEPWRIAAYGWLFGPDAWGAGVSGAREVLRGVVDGLVEEDRPATLYLAAAVLDADGRSDRALEVRRRLLAVDPGNRLNAVRIEQMEVGRPALPEPGALAIIDPEARLAAMGRRPGGSDAVAWWRSRADAQQALGQDEAAVRSLARLARVEATPSAELAYAEAALEAGRRLGAAHRAADRAVVRRMRRPVRQIGADEADERAAWAEDLADALVVRARVAEARGRMRSAADDLGLAVRVAPEVGEPRVRLGLLTARAPSRRGQARDLLATGLALGVGQELRLRGEAALDAVLRQTGTWSPGGSAGYVDDIRRTMATSAPDDAAGELPDITMVLEDGERSLSSVQGPVVVDLWATWCGACKLALPHLDALARKYEGEVTFVALSVDADPERAAAYLRQAGQGETAFLPAWGGPEAQERLGVRGVPAYFVLDAEGRVVAHATGFGPGDRSLERAVERVLRR